VIVLGFDTATPATAVGLLDGDAPGDARERRHEPAPGERPGHAAQLLGLANELLDDAGLRFADVDRVAVGLGPGTFTGLRIGVATARALAQASGAGLVGVSTLRALAAAAEPDAAAGEGVLAVVDARRGEAFVAGFRDGEQVLAPAALAPEALERLAPPAGGGIWLAAGDGAIRFRDALERAGATVLPDIDPAHRISAAATCRLARAAGASPREDVLPVYVRAPDAVMVRRS
jgi:tRNA threonylcarbamoyladenosine biosynthesis protein TsaB